MFRGSKGPAATPQEVDVAPVSLRSDPPRSGEAMSRSVLRQIALAVGALATIVGTVTTVRPVYANRQPVVGRLLSQSWRDSAYRRAPWIQDTTAAALGTPQFQRDQEAFAEDLVATGHVDEERAEELATFAV